MVPFQAIGMQFSSFERSDTNRAVWPHKMARGIEIPDLERRGDCTIYVVYKQVT